MEYRMLGYKMADDGGQKVGKFVVPSVDDIDEITKKSFNAKRLFQSYRSTGNSLKDNSEKIREKKDAKSIDVAPHDLRKSSSEKSKITEEAPALSLKDSYQTVTVNEQGNKASVGKFSSSTTKGPCLGGTSSGMAVGKSFKETFSFLKDTHHYEEPKLKQTSGETSDKGVKMPEPLIYKPSKPNAIIVHSSGNPILKHVRNVPWEFGDIVPDYVLGQTTCALFLSLRYHNFNPEYIHGRLKDLGKRFDLRILLIQVDVKDPHQSLRELAKIAILADCTLILAWSVEEAGRYLETYKAYENKPADSLQGQVEGDYLTKLTECLTSVKSVNKTDVVTLLSNFHTLERIIGATKEELALCPGIGPQKARRLFDVFHESFIIKRKENLMNRKLLKTSQ